MRRVGRLARAQGSLVARKFVPSTNNSSSTTTRGEDSDAVASGQITVEEWESFLTEAQQSMPIGTYGDSTDAATTTTTK